MSIVTFDTHKFIKTLEAAGLSEAQAEAFARAQQEMLSDVLNTSLATKMDMNRIEMKLTEHDGEFKLVRWMLGLLMAGVASLI
ncbi:hypothetical protein, partial [Bordetella avium]